MFFGEFSSLLHELVTRSEPLNVAGDINIRLDRPDDHHSTQLLDALSAQSLQSHVNSPIHNRGGVLDIVATRADLTVPVVSVLKVGISDRRLLRWVSQLERPPRVYHTSTYRPWRHVNVDEFKVALRQSTLCADSAEGDDDVDFLADQYNSEITFIADRLAPLKTVTYRRRASDAWFDD